MRKGTPVLWVLSVLVLLTIGLVSLRLVFTYLDHPFAADTLQTFTREVLERGRQYDRGTALAEGLQTLAFVAVLLGLCFHPAGVRTLAWLEGRGGHRFWIGVVCVSLGIGVIRLVTELPFELYLNYLHPQAYGFTQQTAGQWLAAHVKSAATINSIGLLYTIPIYLCIRRWPRGWWAASLGVTVVISLGIRVAFGALLIPGPTRALSDPQVAAVAQRMSERAGLEVPIEQLSTAHRSTTPNAFAVPGFRPRIVINDAMLRSSSTAELEVVIGHELGHVRTPSTAPLLFQFGFLILPLVVTAWVLQAMVGVGRLGLTAPHQPRGLALYTLTLFLVLSVTGPLMTSATRLDEAHADQYSLELTRNPEAFVSLFKLLATTSPGDIEPVPVVEILAYDHPAIMNRIRMARAYQRQLQESITRGDGATAEIPTDG